MLTTKNQRDLSSYQPKSNTLSYELYIVPIKDNIKEDASKDYYEENVLLKFRVSKKSSRLILEMSDNIKLEDTTFNITSLNDTYLSQLKQSNTKYDYIVVDKMK